MRNFCNQNCSAPKKTEEEYFTREEILKLRQRRPELQAGYEMKKVKVSRYQKAMRDLREINDMIDKM